ncbi:MAG: hypothetical protein KAJ86_08335 [Alphaproteobacteria bacterium]|nr:hypothetical protein [Alphaproteobacteria bacterium]
MSLEYAEKRIRDALRLTSGNKARARQQVIVWSFEDHKLMQELTKHHLTGIVAYHMERVVSGRSKKVKNPPPDIPEKSKETDTDDEFGIELLKAVANSSSAVFGLEGSSSLRDRGQASQRHINSIRKMAREIKQKKSE